MNRYNKDLGDFGEYVAADFLEAKGYRVLERNFYVKGDEIDIIAENRECLVFVEVKTRSNSRFGTPVESVGFRKQQHMLAAARAYLYRHSTSKEIRFDVMEVYANLTDGTPSLMHIHHIENIIMEGIY